LSEIIAESIIILSVQKPYNWNEHEIFFPFQHFSALLCTVHGAVEYLTSKTILGL
jgi:hypothetical protein